MLLQTLMPSPLLLLIPAVVMAHRAQAGLMGLQVPVGLAVRAGLVVPQVLMGLTVRVARQALAGLMVQVDLVVLTVRVVRVAPTGLVVLAALAPAKNLVE